MKRIENNKIMLIYNSILEEDLSLSIKDVPADWVITTDRRYFQQADAVVFYLPSLELENDLEKQERQIWIAWCLEPKKNHSWMEDPEIKNIFDIWMTYRQDADVVYPFYRHEYLECFTQEISAERKQNKKCVFVDEKIIFLRGGRMFYLRELMKHTGIDSNGRLLNNQKPSAVNENETKPDMYRDYKFVIAFEDAHEPDYVTEKFFDPLIADSVPIYLGAPNIDEFAPGDNCFVDVRQFESPQALAHFINTCYEDEQLYAQFFEWKNRPLRQAFLQKAAMQKEHPFVRLCRKVDAKRLSQ